MPWLSQKLSPNPFLLYKAKFATMPHSSFLYLSFASQLMSLVFVYLYPLCYFHSDPDPGGIRGSLEPKSVNKFLPTVFLQILIRSDPDNLARSDPVLE
jgi:hypothetical protein